MYDTISQHSENIYQYVGGNPVTHTDRFGLADSIPSVPLAPLPPNPSNAPHNIPGTNIPDEGIPDEGLPYYPKGYFRQDDPSKIYIPLLHAIYLGQNRVIWQQS